LDYYIPGDKCNIQVGLFYCQIYGNKKPKYFYRLQWQYGVSKAQCKLIIACMLIQKVQEKQSDTWTIDFRVLILLQFTTLYSDSWKFI